MTPLHEVVNTLLETTIVVLALMLIVVGFVLSHEAENRRQCEEHGHDWEWDIDYEVMVCRRCQRTPSQI